MTVDVVVLTMCGPELRVLLVMRANEADPFHGQWALPGAFKQADETLDQAARRVVESKAGLSLAGGPPLRQLRTFGDPGRDPRSDVVTVAFSGFRWAIDGLRAGVNVSEVGLFPVSAVVNGQIEVGFDHRQIVTEAVERAAYDLERSNLAIDILPTEFTLTDLKALFEALWDSTFDERNFRRAFLPKVDTDGVGRWLEATGAERHGGGRGRPANLYRSIGDWSKGGPLRRPRPV